MPTTWTTTTEQTSATFVTSVGSIAGTFTFNVPNPTPAYTTSFLTYNGEWQTLETIWNLVSGVWGEL